MVTELYLWQVNPHYAATHADVVFEAGGSAWVLTTNRVYPLEAQMGVIFDDAGMIETKAKIDASPDYTVEVIRKGAGADVDYLLETQRGTYT